MSEQHAERMRIGSLFSGIGAPHLRKRIFVVACLTDTDRIQLRQQPGRGIGESWERPPVSRIDGAKQLVPDTKRIRCEALPTSMGYPDSMREPQSQGLIDDVWRRAGDPSWWTAEPDVGRVAHGIPARAHRLRALGNAVVPQCAEVIGHMILEMATVGQ